MAYLLINGFFNQFVESPFNIPIPTPASAMRGPVAYIGGPVAFPGTHMSCPQSLSRKEGNSEIWQKKGINWPIRPLISRR